jgi:hypothetical protein
LVFLLDCRQKKRADRSELVGIQRGTCSVQVVERRFEVGRDQRAAHHP